MLTFNRYGLLKVLFTVFMALAVLSCSTIDPKAVKSQTQNKHIVVVSMLGSELETTIMGITIFGTENGIADISEWEVDTHAASTAQKSLNASHEYTQVGIIKEVSAVKDDDKPPILLSPTQADFLLVIEPYRAGYPDPMFYSSLYFGGLGIAQGAENGLFEPVTYSYVGIELKLFDLHTQKLLGSLRKFEHRKVTKQLTSGGSFKWKKLESAEPKITAEKLSALQEPMLTQLNTVINRLLDEMGLHSAN